MIRERSGQQSQPLHERAIRMLRTHPQVSFRGRQRHKVRVPSSGEERCGGPEEGRMVSPTTPHAMSCVTEKNGKWEDGLRLPLRPRLFQSHGRRRKGPGRHREPLSGGGCRSFMAGRVSGGLEATTDRHPPRMRHAPYPAACRLAGHGPVLERHVGTRPWIRFGTDSRTPRGHAPHIPDGVPSDRRRASAARRMEPHSHGSVTS